MAGKRKFLAHGALVMLLAIASSTAGAAVVDLTTANSSGTINGAIYQQVDPSSTGTGVIDSFAQIGAANQTTVQGYNTTVNGTFDNGAADNFNHSITLSAVPVVDLSGVLYRQFLLDINENNNASGDQYLSIDDLQLFVGGTVNSSVETLTAGVLDHDGTLVYRMDAGGDNWVALNYALNTGSGSGDMFLYIPDSLFAGFQSTDVITLYSHFGGAGVDPTGFTGNFSNSDGFEEWAVLTGQTVIPEPTTISLLGLGLAGLFVRRAKRSIKN
jgi:hypothetical protein